MFTLSFHWLLPKLSFVLRDRSLFSGGGGGGYYILGVGHYFLNSTLGTAIFKEMPLRGGLRLFEIGVFT